ncbi:MAG TPA: DUF3300 domain-containing protein [Candidatus Binataceae bacterium]|nr:DUF3300 domain-containing protein [Candidatus Binataceae bacterium]
MLTRRNAFLLMMALTLLASPGALQTSGLALAAPESAGAAPSAQELQQLVSPIALYPDTLVAQILAASTYPSQIVEAARFVKNNPTLKGQALAQQVNQQAWDPSVKSLTQFPSVLSNMNKNLSWTSALGDAYYNDPQAVLKEIQGLRNQAQQSGNLKTTPQQIVTQEGQTIIIQPANPQVIYVPEYNPTVVYGAPVQTYPGYSSTDMMMAGLVGFGVGMIVGSAISGSSGWGCNWGNHTVVYNNHTYVSNSNNFYNHNWSNNNWNGNHPSSGYNNWSNNMRNQNWQQAKTDFNQSNPNWNQNHPNSNSANHWQQANNQGMRNSGSYGRQGNGAYGGGSYNASNSNRGYGGGSGSNGWGGGGRSAFGGSDRSGGGAFGDSARGRWSSGGFRGGGGFRR